MIRCDVERRIAGTRLGNRASCGIIRIPNMVIEVRPPNVFGWLDFQVTSRNDFVRMTKTHQKKIATPVRTYC